jgi:leucyl aminopeptidase
MQVEVRREDPAAVVCDALIIPLTQSDSLPRSLAALDRALDGRIQTYLDAASFKGDSGDHVGFPAGDGIGAAHVVLVGLGEARSVDARSVREAAGRAVMTLTRRKKLRAALLVPAVRRLDARATGQTLAEGAILGGYRFDGYKTLDKGPPGLEKLVLLATGSGSLAPLRAGVRIGVAIGESVNAARDLANEPGSVATPAYLASQARVFAKEAGLTAHVLTPRELEKQKMGAILAVGRGSANPPRLIVLEHGEPSPRRPTIALVGKGITFDTGGISIKPAANMDAMKGDMSGGAAVLGAMRAIGLLKLPLHVVGIVAAAQNMPDGNAYLPGDIVETAAGITLEILNTDAEGRVVLSDALHYATHYEPDAIIDLATLTGAKIVALGSSCCAVIGSDEKLIQKLRDAGDRAHERAWPLPLWPEHKRKIKGDVGDLKNTGGREAGSIMAAALLSHFVGDFPWAHLDIAGNEFSSSNGPLAPRGATGFGVRLLVELLRHWR